METFFTLLILAIWLWIGTYGYLASRKKKQKAISATWVILIVVVAAYILSTLFA